jgi:hypothetical protein
MSLAESDVTVEILKDIRDEIRGVRTELRGEIRQTNERLDVNNQRLGAVELALLDVAEQQRFVVRYTKVMAEREGRLEPRVSALEARVDKLESK